MGLLTLILQAEANHIQGECLPFNRAQCDHIHPAHPRSLLTVVWCCTLYLHAAGQCHVSKEVVPHVCPEVPRGQAPAQHSTAQAAVAPPPRAAPPHSPLASQHCRCIEPGAPLTWCHVPTRHGPPYLVPRTHPSRPPPGATYPPVTLSYCTQPPPLPHMATEREYTPTVSQLQLGRAGYAGRGPVRGQSCSAPELVVG